MEGGIERLSETGGRVVFFYGDPEYCKKSGFGSDAATKYLPLYELANPFGWLAIVLHEEGFNRTSDQDIVRSVVA
jgi:hypothetical protein